MKDTRFIAIALAVVLSTWASAAQATPGAFSLATPINGACVGSTPRFSWFSALGATSYTLAATPSSGPVVTQSGIASWNYTLTSAQALAESGNPYVWTVTAYDGTGSTGTSTWSLFVDATPPAGFDLLGPTDGAWGSNAGTTFSWSPSADTGCAGLQRYRLYIDGTLCKDNIPPGTTTATLASTTCTGLGGGPHTWSVAAEDNAGNVRWVTQAPDGMGGWTLNLDNRAPGVVVAARGWSMTSNTAFGSTGVFVSVGQIVDVSASGTWCFNGCSSDCHGPEGSVGDYTSGRDAAACAYASLVISIGGTYYCVGAGSRFTATSSGMMYFVANDDDLSNCSAYTMSVNASVWTTPWTLLAPASNATLATATPAFSWAAMPDEGVGGVTYQLYIDFAASGSAGTTLTTTPPASLTEGTHRWNVRACDALNNCTDSPTRFFTVDVIPPSAFMALSPTDRGCSGLPTPNLCWEAAADATSGVAKYQIWVDGAPSVDNIPPGTTCSPPGAPLAAGRHEWHAVAIDRAGNSRASVALASGASVFQDGFETGTGAWTVASPWARTTSTPHGGSYSLTDSPTGNYANNANVLATMTSGVSLVGASAASVSFWHRYALETSWDYGTLEVSSGGGAYVPLQSWTGYQVGWVQATVSLLAYAGAANVRLRYRLNSNSSVVDDGWYVDDLVIQTGATTPLSTVFVDWAPPAAFNLVAPANGSTVYSLTPTFRWTASSDVSGLDHYELWVDGVLLAGALAPVATSFTPITPLAAGVYSFYARAVDVCGSTTSTAVWNVTMYACAPATSEACAGTSTGECDPGTRTCSAGGTWGACVGVVGPSVETCNGLDDDCNGTVDNGNPGGGAACTNGIGACTRAGVRACAAGTLLCNATPAAPNTETCNGIDDDCDGIVDDGDPGGGASCTNGVGVCMRTGVRVCSAGALSCNATAGPPTTETCNALDDDCDGSVDDGVPVGAACTAGIGACMRSGALSCAGGTYSACSAVAGSPSTETCNAVDDDCDGSTDDGVPVGAACTAGIGACMRSGTLSCVGGTYAACSAAAAAPTTEACNAVDDDCDGVTDNSFTLGTACTSGIGACTTTGVLVCAPDGSVTVCGATAGAPTTEICDGIDDDCDGSIDGAGLCGASSAGHVCVTAGFCGCTVDADCGATDSGRICEPSSSLCVDGCHSGGNGCATGLFCTSDDATVAGVCTTTCSFDANCAATPARPICGVVGSVRACVECASTDATRCDLTGVGGACLSDGTCGCALDTDCATERRCDAALRHCVDRPIDDAGIAGDGGTIGDSGISDSGFVPDSAGIDASSDTDAGTDRVVEVGGCGCEAAGAGSMRWGLLAMTIGLALLARRRRTTGARGHGK